MIFAAGIGSRLRPITDSIPKAMVEVCGITMLQHTIMRMADADITDIVVNVHHHASKIVDFLADNAMFGLNIAVSDESAQLLDTGGGLLKAAPLLQGADAIVLHNADVFTDISLQRLLEKFEHEGADAMLAVRHRSSSRYLLCDDKQRMRGWINVNTGEIKPPTLKTGEADTLDKVGFCGIHVIRASSVMPQLREYADVAGRVFSMTPFYIDRCDSLDIRVDMADEQASWFDIGRPETLALARQAATKV